MSSQLYKPDGDLEHRPRLVDIVPVRFYGDQLRRDADARQFYLTDGDEVIVDSRFGPVLAEVVGPVERKTVDGEELPRVIRKANDADRQRADENRQLEQRAHRFALQRIQARELPMKLIRVRCMEDRSRIVFYFSADGRIDFRALVRDLAAEFKTRIEMRQIGVRDGAQMLGGIGPCGRELCCSTFLDNFQPISIRIARKQGLTLNPDRISGMCGRLMCCLVYEQKVYRRLKARLPDTGQQVRTRAGIGTVDDVDVINRRVTVELDDGHRRTVDLDEVQLLGGDSDDKPNTAVGGEKLWGGDPPRKRGTDE